MLKLCQQKQKAGLEDCGSGLEWGDEGELTFQTVVDKRDWHSKQQHQDSSSSDEDDEEPRDMHMEVDTTDRMFLSRILLLSDIHKKRLSYRNEISAWDTTEPLNTGTILPPVNPWDVVPSEPVESTGWANFENFENTLSIENTVSGEKKLCDELTEKTSEATAATEKDMTSSESIGDDNEKNKDYVDNQIVGTKLSLVETDLNDSKSDEHKIISANENASPSELPINRYLYSV